MCHVLRRDSRWQATPKEMYSSEAFGKAPMPGRAVRVAKANYLFKLTPIGRIAVGRFPQHGFHHGETCLAREFIDQSSDVFGRGILVHQEQWLAGFPQQIDKRIVFPQQHSMVQFLIDPSIDDPLDVPKVENHSPLVEILRLDGNNRPAIMSVEVPALAGVIHQAVAVAEVDFA